MEIELQWSDVSATTDEVLVTKEYYGAFSHFVAMRRSLQQPDIELYNMLKGEWYNPLQPKEGIFGRILSSLSKPMKKNAVVVNMEQCGQIVDYNTPDYNNNEEE
jgi:hypothetical protein